MHERIDQEKSYEKPGHTFAPSQAVFIPAVKKQEAGAVKQNISPVSVLFSDRVYGSSKRIFPTRIPTARQHEIGKNHPF
jgi:hypothetical protein